MSTETLERPGVVTELGVGDDEGRPEDHAHIVAKDKLADAIIFGTPITALCGYTWVPSRDPEKLPTCAECVRRYNAGMRP